MSHNYCGYPIVSSFLRSSTEVDLTFSIVGDKFQVLKDKCPWEIIPGRERQLHVQSKEEENGHKLISSRRRQVKTCTSKNTWINRDLKQVNKEKTSCITRGLYSPKLDSKQQQKHRNNPKEDNYYIRRCK